MFILFTLIIMRMSSFIGFNPFFGRKIIPAKVKIALIMFISLNIYIYCGGKLEHTPESIVEYVFMLLTEMLLGLSIGFALEIIVMVVRFAAFLIDFSMGLSMAQIYDAQYQTQSSISSQLYYSILMLMFFSSGADIRFFSIILKSGIMIPYGAIKLDASLALYIIELFKDSVIMAAQFAFPVVSMELLGELAVGIIMRMVPQINVFVINFQIKIMMGLFVMYFLFDPSVKKISDLLDIVFTAFIEMISLVV